MSTQGRAGIRAARSLLSLLEESSAEELEAAESILGGEEALVEILQLLRKFKEHEEQPLSVERLRDIVREELVGLHFSMQDMMRIVKSALDGFLVRTPPGATVENALDSALRHIETEIDSPGAQVEAFINLLLTGVNHAGPQHAEKVNVLLRDLSIQALTENTVMFPTLHSLAQLRTRWAEEPLPYQHQEPRRDLVTRLLVDAVRHMPRRPMHTFASLLREGLRGPADGAIAAVRKMKPKKAHGE